jgi:hypothetical protein
MRAVRTMQQENRVIDEKRALRHSQRAPQVCVAVNCFGVARTSFSLVVAKSLELLSAK